MYFTENNFVMFFELKMSNNDCRIALLYWKGTKSCTFLSPYFCFLPWFSFFFNIEIGLTCSKIGLQYNHQQEKDAFHLHANILEIGILSQFYYIFRDNWIAFANGFCRHNQADKHPW